MNVALRWTIQRSGDGSIPDLVIYSLLCKTFGGVRPANV